MSPVFVNVSRTIVGKTPLFQIVMFKDFYFITVVSVQPIQGADPNHTIGILKDCVNGITG
jgi:hypothetical protein